MAKEYYFIFYSILAVILLIGVKPAVKGGWCKDALSLRTSKGLLGFCAVAIMLHHMSQTIYFAKEDTGILLFMVDIGVCFVGMFFFFSGYGLYTSLRDKPDYLKGFMKNRLPAILVPFYICNFVFILGSYFSGYEFKEGELMPYLSGAILMNSQMWYIVEVLILYVLFYVVFRLIKNRDAACIVYGICVMLLITFSLRLGHDTTTPTQGLWFHGEWWYNTTLMVWVGIMFARWEEQILGLIRKFYGLVFMVFVVLSVFLYNRTIYMLQNKGYWVEWDGYPGYKEKWQTLGVQFSFVFVVIITVVILTQKIRFGNKILDFLGEIALELYLIHNLFLLYTPGSNRVIYILTCYTLSILSAVVLHMIDRKLIGLMRGSRKESVQDSSKSGK
ncbi:MAG: acyltransferase [Lachnospiraceae bacterium]|nr:acyltransferase [Lachnospiraceae bacterium]